MNQTRKIIAAVLAVLTLGAFAAQTAGALGTPWYCHVTPSVYSSCKAIEVGRTVDRKAGAVADAAGTTYQTGEAAGRVVVNGTELAGTLLDKTADATSWVNEQAQKVPTRTLLPGECITTTVGRYCMPAAAATTAAPAQQAPKAGAVPVGTCVVDSNGRKWCVTS